MPLLAYFTVVGAVLLGLLYVAEAQLGPSPSLSVTTNFYGLPAPYKASTSTPILTARDAPAPDMAPFAFAQSTATARPAAGAAVAQSIGAPAQTAADTALVKLDKTAAKSKTAKARKIARPVAGPNRYAHSIASRGKTHAVVW